MNIVYEPSISTKLKACAALLLKGEVFGMAAAAERLGWSPEVLHQATRPWCDMQELPALWLESTREEHATLLLFVAEAEAQG